MRTSFASILALAASASAITITFPDLTGVNGTPAIDLSVPQTITWNSTTNDASSFNITLVTAPQNVPGIAVKTFGIAPNVSTSDGKYVLAPPTGLTVNQTYQIFFYGYYTTGAVTLDVLAESPFFTAAKISTAASSTSSSGSSPTGSSGSPTGSGASPSQSSTKKNSGSTVKAFGGAAMLGAAVMMFL